MSKRTSFSKLSLGSLLAVTLTCSLALAGYGKAQATTVAIDAPSAAETVVDRESKLSEKANFRVTQKAIGGTGRNTKAIGGTGRTSKAIGGTGRTTKAIGGTGRTSKAIGGTGRTTKAIGGTGRTSKAIGGTGRTTKAIGGTGRTSKAIGGTGRISKTLGGSDRTIEITQAKPMPVIADLRRGPNRLLVGRIDRWDPSTETAEVMGQSVVLHTKLESPVGRILYAEGSIAPDGSLNIELAHIDEFAEYVDGSTEVVASGVITAINESLGTLRIGDLIVDYTPALWSTGVQPKIGLRISAKGVRPIVDGYLLAFEVDIYTE